LAPRARQFSPQINALYHDAVENLRFAKLQQWRVTNYALLSYAAVYFIRDKVPFASCEGKVILTAIVAIVAAFNVFVLWKLEDSMGKFRDRIDWVYDHCFTARERSELLLKPKTLRVDKGIYLGLVAVSLAGAGLVAVLVLCEAQH
jgi:hypothetical protein